MALIGARNSSPLIRDKENIPAYDVRRKKKKKKITHKNKEP